VVDSGPVVETRGLSKWFGDTTALDGVDLAVEAGAVHGLVGPNGAGKTTLLSTLFGLVLPDEGVVRLLGRTRAEAGRDWLEGVAGFVEAPRFYPYLSGRRNLTALAGLDGGDASHLVEQAMERVGLQPASRQKVRGYSLGMRQRLGLAAALLRRPRVLILDEPTNGLDPVGTRELHSALRDLATDGVAILMSSHDMTHINELCSTVTILARGQVAFAGSLLSMRDLAPDPVWRLRTSDDGSASTIAHQLHGVSVSHDLAGLQVVAGRAQLDEYVVRLGRAGVAVRALAEAVSPLEALFFRLTEDGPLMGSTR
jgi:ABC-2 type transport system ATP-binding protein